jgi:diketogulonate reductase-like aldo/keto reductase
MARKGGNSRRAFLAAMGAGIGLVVMPLRGLTTSGTRSVVTKPIPATGEGVPVIGTGTWITFNVGEDPVAREQRTEVLRCFFELGGGVIDSSPMYGSSEEVVGYCLGRLGPQAGLFSATKVWTSSGTAGVKQVAESHRLWGVDRFDLLQVHNLLAWKAHLKTLLGMRAQGKLRYVGITTSHGRRHRELEAIMRSEPIDFVQATYNAVDREVEARILPLAADRGIAFIANRPFQRGALIDRVQRHPLPDWAAEAGASNWAEFLLKFIVSHPAVTCTIPATSRVDHMRENMGAATGTLPEPALRARMAGYVAGL